MSDFERMPEYFPQVAESVRVVKREGNKLWMEVRVRSFGRVFLTKMETTLKPPAGFVSDNESEFGTAGHEEFLMEEVEGGTRINYVYEVELK